MMCLLGVQILFFNQEHQSVSLQLCPITLKDQLLSPSRVRVLSRILLFALVVAAKTSDVLLVFLYRLAHFLSEVYGFYRVLNSSCCVIGSLKILFNYLTS